MSALDKTEIPVLPEEVPVEMPDLPTRLQISTLDQYRAITDSTRSRILNVVQLTPATAKQIAERLGATPGAIGHHLHVLEEAGLVQVSARRQVRGIVANYYTRTARLFEFSLPEELVGAHAVQEEILSTAQDELSEAGREDPDSVKLHGFPHARLSPERAEQYAQLLQEIFADLLNEPANGPGEVYGVLISMFKSPAYLQNRPTAKPERD